MTAYGFLENHISLTSCNHIKQICTPLHSLGILDFIYLRIYKANGKFIDLSSNSDWSTLYFKKLYNHEYPENIVQKHTHILNISNIELWCFDEDNIIWAEAKEFFNLGNGITIVKENADYKEIYYFASHKTNYKINYFYLNNLDLLEKFTYYFKEKAAKLIKLHESFKLDTPNIYAKKAIPDLDSADLRRKFFSEIQHTKFYSNNYFLRQRELECIKWLSRGKSFHEIAKILEISERTVETHINNVKKKLNCYKSTELIQKLNSLLSLI